MKLEITGNKNYAATIVRVRALDTLDNCDNVVAFPIFGSQAIVGKDTQIGTLGVYFPAETRLAPDYAHANNLYRHADMNADPEAKGYLEQNRRVKALKFRGHRSDALFMPLESLSCLLGTKTDMLNEGDTFDTIDGEKVCEKYVIREPRTRADHVATKHAKAFKRVDERMLPEHVETDNWWRNEHRLSVYDWLTVTQKLHGTSIRIANTLVKREPRLRDKIARRFGIKVADTEYAHVYGSRKVIKDANNPNQNHYYDTDLWSHYGAKYDTVIPEGFVIYGELIGWTPDGAPIQKNYTYGIPQGEAELYVYRVATISPEGVLTDLSWKQVEAFCHERAMNTVPIMWQGWKYAFNVDRYMDTNYSVTQPVPGVVRLPVSVVDEGVVVRVDGARPDFLKAKSPLFLRHETLLLDAGTEDLESQESAPVAA